MAAAPNLKDIDPAVVDAGAKKPKTMRPPVAQGVKQAPSFPPTASVVEATDDGDYLGFNPSTHAVVKTSDGKFVAIPRTAKVPGLTIKDGKETVEFPFGSETLIAVNHWVEKYGQNGEAAEKFPAVITHTDFHTLLHSEWDKYFFDEVLQNHHGDTDALLGAINFAEKNKMEGLLSFCIAGLSCIIRGKGDVEVLHAFHQPEGVKDAVDESAINAAYPWIKAAIAPK